MVSLETVNRVLQYAQGQAEFTSTAGLTAEPLEKLLGQGRLTARSIRISTVGIHSAVTEHGGVPPGDQVAALLDLVWAPVATTRITVFGPPNSRRAFRDAFGIVCTP